MLLTRVIAPSLSPQHQRRNRLDARVSSGNYELSHLDDSRENK